MAQLVPQFLGRFLNFLFVTNQYNLVVAIRFFMG
jgi:hypothetical protein